jgi:hypothetical protein
LEDVGAVGFDEFETGGSHGRFPLLGSFGGLARCLQAFVFIFGRADLDLTHNVRKLVLQRPGCPVGPAGRTVVPAVSTSDLDLQPAGRISAVAAFFEDSQSLRVPVDGDDEVAVSGP